MKAGMFNEHGDPFRRDGVPLPPLWGDVEKLYAGGFADVRLLTGEILTNVPLPEGAIKKGKGKGRFGRYRVGVRVLVQFVGGNRESPVITDIYPIPGRSSEKGSIDRFYEAQSALGKDSEDFEDHHESGYIVRYTGKKIEVVDGTTSVLTVDLQSKEVHINLDRLKVGDGSIPVSDGEKLKQWMTDFRGSVQALYQAIVSTATTAMDGGAAYKTGLVSAVQSNPLPTVPSDLNDTNSKIGPSS